MQSGDSHTLRVYHDANCISSVEHAFGEAWFCAMRTAWSRLCTTRPSVTGPGGGEPGSHGTYGRADPDDVDAPSTNRAGRRHGLAGDERGEPSAIRPLRAARRLGRGLRRPAA